MLSFCLRVILWCFSFVKAHYKWFLLIHVIYACFIARFMSKMFDTKVMAYNLLPEKVKKEYNPFLRNGSKRVKKWQLILGAIYLLPIRLMMFIYCDTLIWMTFKIVTRGLDIKKPYPKWRVNLLH